MSRTPVEDRLAAALAARADRVTADDLADPADLREHRATGRRRAWVRTGLVAAMVAGLVVAGSAVWWTDRGAEISPAPPSPQLEDAGLRIELDLVPAGERLTAAVPAWDGEVSALVRARRLTVRAGGGGVSGAGSETIGDGDRDPSMSSRVLLGEDSSAGVVVHVGHASGYELRPFTIELESEGATGRVGFGGQAEVVRPEGAPPFHSGFADHAGAQHRVLSWVGSDGSGYTLVVPLDQTNREVRDLAGPAEVWRWRLAGGVLRPARLSDSCVDAGAVVACGTEAGGGLPPELFPIPLPTAKRDEELSVQEVRVTGPGGQLRAQLLDDGGRLAMSTGSVTVDEKLEVTEPAALAPHPIRGEQGEIGVAVVVYDQEMGFYPGPGEAGSRWVVWVRHRDEDGETRYSEASVRAPDGPFRLGTGRTEGDRLGQRSWVADNGRAYTVVWNGAWSDGPVEAWRWVLDGDRLRPERLDDMCVTDDALAPC